MTKLFSKSKKPCFLPIFGLFSQILSHIFPPGTPAVTHSFIWVSSTMTQFKKKLMIQLQENALTEGRTEGWTLFYRTLPATTGGPKKKYLRKYKCSL